MSTSDYQVEYDGIHYIVTRAGNALMSFDSCESAFDAKRDFENKRYPSGWDKVPPSVRYAKQLRYGG